jgi:MSHA pilin protein MshD
MTAVRRHLRCRGFTLVEVGLCTLVVGVLLSAALTVAGRSGVAQYKLAERATARFLADGLITDIMSLAYEEPNGTPLFGREVNELITSKANYDDVDDFNGWTETPPQDRDGTAMSGMSGWKRSVTVDWVTPADVTQTSLTESGAKRVVVTIKHNNITITTRTAIKTKVQ